ncbi:cytidylyltransferase domain-containing protein [Sphingobacterium sp. ML3W]|uniref:cytidylyltransferase domain-containing protein n=1 Tax=Sphingobacterium sp. ML3W TaxID=1538644 RepID=UPI0006899245|nr:hypothetical protein [Sphingobacterium sp. ML3W]
MIGIIIQARLGSTRFPKKILKKFGSETILSFLINRLLVLNIPIVVATTDNIVDDELCEYLILNNISFYRGSEDNVLQRFIETANSYDFDKIIRICSDSPFIDVDKMIDLIKTSENIDFDYLSYSYQSLPTVLCHFGVFTEIVKRSALIKLNDTYNLPDYCEHVTFGLYKNPDNFNIRLLALPESYSKYEKIRLSLDTESDYLNLLEVEKALGNDFNSSFENIAEYIINDNKLIASMELNIINNKK